MCIFYFIHFFVFLAPSLILLNKFSYRMVHVIAMEVLPEERDRKYYADSYSCCPPPLFILLITIIEVRFYQFASLSITIRRTTTTTTTTRNVCRYRLMLSRMIWYDTYTMYKMYCVHSPGAHIESRNPFIRNGIPCDATIHYCHKIGWKIWK